MFQPHPGSLALKAQLRDLGNPTGPSLLCDPGPPSTCLWAPPGVRGQITLEAPWKPGQSEFQPGLFSAQVPPQAGCMSSGKSPPLSVPGASLSWGWWHRCPRKQLAYRQVCGSSPGGLVRSLLRGKVKCGRDESRGRSLPLVSQAPGGLA